MTRVRVEGFTISLGGFGAGPNQDINNPLGFGGTELHQWLRPTRTFQRSLFGQEGGTTGVDDDFAGRGFSESWGLDSWQEHVRTRSWRLAGHRLESLVGRQSAASRSNPHLDPSCSPPIEMEGGTTFHFITGGIREALDRARETAGGKDVRTGAGPSTIQQYLREGLIDELHIAIAPVLLGRGEPLFQGVDLRVLGYECVEFAASEKATHVVLRRQGQRGA